ncbi:MAG TPA: hypothetical protein VFZ61_26550, partial [Polyangiales bacterium]
MQFEKLFRLLLRNDVKELALQADRPPCALVNDAYTPVVPRNFSEEEVIAALVEAGGQAQVLGLVETPRRWEFDHPSIGRVRVSAGYHDGVLQARFRSSGKPAQAAPPEPPPPPLGRAPAAPTATPFSAAPRMPPPPPAITFEAELPIPEASQAANLAELLRTHEPVERQSQPEPRLSLEGGPEQLLDSLLALARRRAASDVHVLADRPPTLRIGGDLIAV